MPSGKDEKTRWLALAAEARAVATEMTESTARAVMTKIARAYENLARRQKSEEKTPPEG